MKQILFILFTFFAIQGIAQQDSIQTVIMEVDYVELADSISIQKKITYTYPSGEKVIREFTTVSDSLFFIKEEEEIMRIFQDRQRMVEELQRLSLEIQTMDVYLQQSDVKFKELKLKKNKI